MALYLLNISVDSADPNPENIPENLSFNDQESIIEIVVEQILGYDNTIKEYDDRDAEDYNKKSNIKIDILPFQTFISISSPSFIESKKQKFRDHYAFLTKGFQQLSTPPPKFDLF